ncbi:hypothetical protein [Streptomyces carpinensis]|uniref:Uncharacterized protein n=1 Tax=Streptomyces carpinensis TaxID=66369 RepID=A0ABV1W3G8_9ACTN|nr:hypothetical protein [Streptomyces carpinensis]
MDRAPLPRSLGHHEDLTYTPVRPELVAEVLADTALDAGVYRHPVRYLRLRDDLPVDQLPLFEE